MTEKSTTYEPAFAHEAVLARLYDAKAEAIKEAFYESCFADEELYESSLAYRSALIKLNEERIEQMQKVEKAMEENKEYEKTLTNRREKIEALRDSLYLLKEHTALLEQGFRFPWSSCVER